MNKRIARRRRHGALILFLSALFFLSPLSPLYAQRSIFRSVGDKTDERLKTVPQTPSAEKSTKDTSATKPALDPLSLLGERPKTLAQSIQIPPEFGRVSETYEGNPKPLIIHIQDVHVHYEAQKNLANILDKLVKDNGLRLILVEGGSGDTSLSFLRAEATKEKRLEVAEKYLKLGKISGEEYLDIVSDSPIILWGIEEEKLYDANLDIFFKVDAVKEKAHETAQALKKIVETLKVSLYSPGIKELEQKKHEYEDGKLQAIEYYQYLGNLAETQNVDLSHYPNFKNFLQASLLEKAIDFQKVDGQHQALIGKLTQVLSKEDLTALAERGLKYKLNQAGPGDYYGFLKEILQKSDPAPGTHQDLDRYIDYVILYAGRDHVELFREGKILEREVKGKLYASNDERTLSEVSDRLDLLLNFLELNLSPDDLKTYQADRKSFLVKEWKKFLLDKMDHYHVSALFPTDISIIDNNWGLLESFYELGMRRDLALVRNALAKINDEKVDVAVLIAGGFHTEQITRLLKEQNYSYVVIAPKITQASDLELYHRILKEKAKPETPAGENLRQLPAVERSVGQLRGDLKVGVAKDGGYKILGDPALVIDLKSAAEIGDGVVFDVSDGKPIRIGKGAKILGNSYVRESSIGAHAVVDSALLDGVFVGKGASVRGAVLRTVPKLESWVFDKDKRYKVTGRVTHIGEGARVTGHATLINTTVGEGAVLEGGVYHYSEIGARNRLSHTKMTLVHTEADVTFKGTPEHPLEASEGWFGYGFYTDQQAFIDSVLHTNEVVSFRFNPETYRKTKRLEVSKPFSLPAISFIGRGVVYSSYSGAPDPSKKHRNGLFKSRFGTLEGGNVPPVRILGIDGTESSAHGYLVVDPLSILTSFLRWIALPGPQPSSDPSDLTQYGDLTHAMTFSVIGYPLQEGKGLDDWGAAWPGAAKYGLSRKDISVPYLFTHSPDTIFTLMKKLTDTLPPGEKSKYDDFVVEMLETGRALAKRDLYEEKMKFHEDQDQNRIAQLEKWIAAYTAHIESSAWRFRNGEPVGWHFENGEWVHDTLDLRRLAHEIGGIEPEAYRQKLFKDFLEKEIAFPIRDWEPYEPILTEEHLPKLVKGGKVDPKAKIAQGADVDPSAFIGPDVVIEEGAVVGPGVILEGNTVIGKGTRVFGSHLHNTTVGEYVWIWGSRLEEGEVAARSSIVLSFLSGKPESRVKVGEKVRLVASRVEDSMVDEETEGNGVLVRRSHVGKNHLLEPYAIIVSSELMDSVRGVNRGIGSRLYNVRVSGLFTDHHLASRISHLSALPISFLDEKGVRHVVANTTNVGGGSYVNPELLGRIFAESAFIGTDTLIGFPDSMLIAEFEKGFSARPIDVRLGFGSIVSGGVRMGEHLINFTEKRGPGPENDRIGGVLLRPDVVMRHILSKTISASSDPFAVDKLMEAKIREALGQAEEELRLVRGGETRHPYYGYKLHSEKQLEEGIELFEQNLDGRWRMENHRFTKGFWLYDEKGRYSWNVPREAGEQEAVSGGRISFATDIGKRDEQEDRVVVYPVNAAGIQGDLLALFDGHGGEQAADVIKRKLPFVFVAALSVAKGDVGEALRQTDAALHELTKAMEAGTMASLTFAQKGRVSGFTKGDTWASVTDRKRNIKFLSIEDNVVVNEEERIAASGVDGQGGGRGAFYQPGSERLSRALGIFPYWEFTRSYGDRQLRRYLSDEARFFDEPFEEGDLLLMGSDGAVSDVRGRGALVLQKLVDRAERNHSAEALLTVAMSDKEEIDPRHAGDNGSLILLRHVTARDGAERYVAQERNWLMTHESLHRRPASAELKAESTRLKQAKDAKILVFHSSVLKEDMGESFSLALDHLAEETGNPLDNDRSVFKAVLLMDDPNMKFQEVENYLAKYHLRREQFYAVVTHDLLEGYGDKEEIRRFGWEASLVYRIKLGDFLETSLSEERIKVRWGEDSNIVIVASEPEAREWTKYIATKRFVIGRDHLKTRLVIYRARRGGEEPLLNLAPLLVTTAAELVGTKNPESTLKDVKGLLTFIVNKIYVDAAPVEEEYFKAYATYLNSV